MLDDVAERFILECIENKSKRDLLKIANFSGMRRGLNPIRSAVTVNSRSKPCNK